MRQGRAPSGTTFGGLLPGLAQLVLIAMMLVASATRAAAASGAVDSLPRSVFEAADLPSLPAVARIDDLLPDVAAGFRAPREPESPAAWQPAPGPQVRQADGRAVDGPPPGAARAPPGAG